MEKNTEVKNTNLEKETNINSEERKESLPHNCEEYVLAELRTAKNKNVELSEALTKCRDDLTGAVNVIEMIKRTFTVTYQSSTNDINVAVRREVLDPETGSINRETISFLVALLGLTSIDDKGNPIPESAEEESNEKVSVEDEAEDVPDTVDLDQYAHVDMPLSDEPDTEPDKK